MSGGEEAGADAIDDEIDEAALDHVVEQQSRRRMTDNERQQVEQIAALETEELEEEEEDSDVESHIRHARVARAPPRTVVTYDPSLASRHVYLGDVDDTGHSRSFLEEGSLVRLPILYLEGIVLFPEVTLPLKVVRPRCKAAVETAISQEHAPFTLAVLYFGRKDNIVYPAPVGTTAEIRQLRHSIDGSITLVARGRQRFRVHDAWSDVNNTPCCLVKILEEMRPLQVPRDAFSARAAVPSRESGKVPRVIHEPQDLNDSDDEQLETTDTFAEIRNQVTRFLNGEGALPRLLLQLSHEDSDEEDGSMVLPRWLRRRNTEDPERSPVVERNQPASSSQAADPTVEESESSQEGNTRKRARADGDWGGAAKAWARDEAKWISRAQRTAWPHWVYRMYDAYDLSRRAADMWRQMVELPSMDEVVGNPGLLSFFIASKMPLPDETRQELLELDVVYRLRREIQLLESMDMIRCKSCKATIARRSDMLVMSADGPMNAFVNAGGYVHETLTLRKARGLALRGNPETEHSWFPGYAWTIANCVCNSHMGWRFSATKNGMNPKAFWGIRRCQIAST